MEIIKCGSAGPGQLALSRSALLLLSGVVVALIAIVAVSLQREARSDFTASSTSATITPQPLVATPPPFSPEEQTFAEALWPLHQEVVEASAGRLTSAGVTFAVDDHDSQRLAAKLTPLRQVFRGTRDKVATIPVPVSLQPVRDRYVELLSVYEQSAAEMLEVVRDGDEGHLINAQRKSEQAAQELVKVGDILWPGEHKPN